MLGGRIRFGGVYVDVRRAPVYVLHYGIETDTAGLCEAFDWLAERCALHGRVGCVHQLKRLLVPAGPQDRARLVAKVTELRELVSETRPPHALVMGNAVVRGAATAVLWVCRPPFPVKMFSDFDEGFGWVSAQLAPRIEPRRPARRVASL